MVFFAQLRRGPARLRSLLSLLVPATAVALALAVAGAGASVSLRSSSSAVTSRTQGSLSIPRPSGVVAGDVLLAGLSARVGPASIGAPSGWTLVRSDSATAGATLTQAVYVKVADSAEPGSYKFTLGAKTGAVGAIAAYSGIDTSSPVLAATGSYTADTSSMVAPSITTAVAARVVGFFGNNGQFATTPPGGMTELVDRTVGTTWGSALEVSDLQQSAAGSTGTETAVATSWSSSSIGQLVALRPLGSGGGGGGGGTTAPSAQQSTLTPSSSTITANGTSTQALTVRAKDSSGNNVTTGGSSVTITRQSGAGTIGGVTDNGNGTYTATVTAPTSTGSGVFVAMLDGNPVESGTASQTQAMVSYASSGGGGGSGLGTSLAAVLPASTGATISVTPSTFQSALSAAAPGQILSLAGGTYGSSSSLWALSASGTGSAPITLTAASGATVTIKGQLKITGSYIRVVGLHFIGPAPDASHTLIWISGGSHVEVWNSELANSYARSAMFVDGSASSFYVADNYFHDNGIFDQANDPLNGQRNNNLDHHIYVASANSGVIANNLMVNAAAFGIQLYPGPVSNVVISGNTIDKTGQASIIVDNVSSCRITGNLLTGSGRASGGVVAGLEVFETVGSGNLVTNNVSDAGIYNDPGSIPTGTNRFNTSPGYAGSGNYQLQSTSPAVGFAEPAYSLSPDYTGASRDSAPDAGAYELH